MEGRAAYCRIREQSIVLQQLLVTCTVRTHKLYKTLLKIVTVSSNKEIKLRCEKTAKVQNSVAFFNHIMLNGDERLKKNP